MRLLSTVLLALVGCGPVVGDEGGTDGGGGSEGAEEVEDTGLLAHLEGVLVMEIVVASDGSIAAAGLSGASLGSDGEFAYDQLWVGAFSAEGELRWSATHPRANETAAVEPTGVSVASDGAVFVSFGDWGDLGGTASRVSKYDAGGELLWDAVVGNRPYDVEALSTGGAVTVGVTLSDNALNAIQGWAQVVAPDGTLAGSGVWVNQEGRNSILDEVVVLPGDELIFSGGWNVSPVSSEVEPWIVWTGTDILPTADVRLPISDDADLLIEAKGLSGGRVLVAGRQADGGRLLVVSADGSVSSGESIPAGWRVGDVLSPTVFLTTQARLCEEPGSSCALEGTIAILDSGVQVLEKTFADCEIEDTVILEPAEAVVALRCGSAAELWRVR